MCGKGERGRDVYSCYKEVFFCLLIGRVVLAAASSSCHITLEWLEFKWVEEPTQFILYFLFSLILASNWLPLRGHLRQQKFPGWAKAGCRITCSHSAVLGWMQAMRCLHPVQAWAQITFHCISAVVWNTELWSESIAERWCIWSGDEVKLLV